MNILTNTEMREADKYTIERLGVPSLTLMERAGESVARVAESMYDGGVIACVCGGGNNGGDGFVCARILQEKGYAVRVVCVADKYTADCAVNRDRFLAIGGQIVESIPKSDLIIDCLFGTGFHGEVTGVYAEWIRAINGMETAVLSVDIPSGVNGDDGEVQSVAVRADITLCIGEVKAGVFLGDGIDYAGEVFRADIGITLPKEAYATRVDGALVRTLVPRRKRNTHKGDYGKCAIVGGSETYTGAAYIATLACLRAGAGYTALFAPETLIKSMYFKLPEALLVATNDGGVYAFNEERFRAVLGYDVIVYGVGMTASEETAKGLAYLLNTYTGKLIIDADGLNSLVVFGDLNALKSARCQILLTPHKKEFARLSGRSVSDINKDGLCGARAFAKEYGVSVLLKSAVSVLTDGARTLVNTTGTAGQAKGGSGDALAGAIGGLCACGLSVLDAGIASAYLIGKSAEIATARLSEYGVVATDLCACLGEAFVQLFAERADD